MRARVSAQRFVFKNFFWGPSLLLNIPLTRCFFFTSIPINFYSPHIHSPFQHLFRLHKKMAQPVKGTWWDVPFQDIPEMGVAIITDGVCEVCISGGMFREIGSTRHVGAHGTRYLIGQPLVGEEGGLQYPRAPYTTVAYTTDKEDAVRHAKTAHIVVRLTEAERAADMEATLNAALPPSASLSVATGQYRPIAGVHSTDTTFIATSLADMEGTLTFAAKTPPAAPSHPPFRVGTCLDYPPLTTVEGDVPIGLEVELLEAVVGKGNVVWVKTSWPELHAGLLAGKYDAAFGGINESAKRRELFTVSRPVLPCAKCILTTETQRTRFDRLSAVESVGVTVVTNPGGTNAMFCAANFKKATIRTATDNKQPFTDLATGKADVMITDSLEALYRQKLTAASSAPLASVCDDSPLTTGHTVSLVRQNCPTGVAFLKCFNDGLETAEGKTAFSNLTAKYLGQPVPMAC